MILSVREAELEAENAELRRQLAELQLRADLWPPASWRQKPTPKMILTEPYIRDMRKFIDWDVTLENDAWHCTGIAYYNKPPGLFRISRFTDKPNLISARLALEYLGEVHQEVVRELAQHCKRAYEIDSDK